MPDPTSTMPVAVRGKTLVGPFPMSQAPVNGDGLYILESPNVPGNPVFSYWDGRRFGLYSTDPDRALSRRRKPSRYRPSQWWGFAKE